jgi:hypothetical protein
MESTQKATYPSTSEDLSVQTQEAKINPVVSNEEIIQHGEGFITGRGRGRINVRGTGTPGMGLHAGSNVVASVTEYNPSSGPFMALADTRVYNVVPFQNGVEVRIDLVWGSDINYKVMLRWG